MPDTYDFEIYFFGLICIHGASQNRKTDRREKQRAKLQLDGVHEQLIYINDKDPSHFTKLKTNVTFSNLPGGYTEVLPSFDALVPHLEDLTKDGVELEPGVASIDVILPGGLLATVDQYDYRTEYFLSDEIVSSGCVARLNLLQVTTPRRQVSLKFNGAEYPVPTNGWVLIANREPDAEDSDDLSGRTARPEFKKHRYFTNAASDAYIATLYELEERCTTPIVNPPNIKMKHLTEVLDIVRTYRVFAHPECSNTNWP